MRNDGSFNMFYQTVLRKSTEDTLIEKQTLLRKEITMHYSVLNYIDGNKPIPKVIAIFINYFRQNYQETLCM